MRGGEKGGLSYLYLAFRRPVGAAHIVVHDGGATRVYIRRSVSLARTLSGRAEGTSIERVRSASRSRERLLCEAKSWHVRQERARSKEANIAVRRWVKVVGRCMYEMMKVREATPTTAPGKEPCIIRGNLARWVEPHASRPDQDPNELEHVYLRRPSPPT